MKANSALRIALIAVAAVVVAKLLLNMFPPTKSFAAFL